MKHFNEFIIESIEDTKKLSHIEHAEDHVLNDGERGFRHSVRTLIGTHHALLGHNTPVKLSTKYDGSPSIVFGTHPTNKKFFVASKSAFNKKPKINYTSADILKNHGHAPGLVNKLTTALTHLPKSTPAGHVYQGDLMHTQGDLQHGKKKIHFKPNTIKYSVNKDSPIGKKIAGSKVGVAVHTEYKGNGFGKMKASFGADTSGFTDHPDVHITSTNTNVKKANYHPALRSKFFSHIKKAKDAHEGHDYSHLNDPVHQTHLKTYINSTVRSGTTPSVEGLRGHVRTKHEKLKLAVKRDSTKQRIEQQAQKHLGHIDVHKDSVHRTLQIHKHLQNAKHVLVKALSSADDFEHSIGGKKTGPEGHVAYLGGKPTKLVNRSSGGFAASNLLSGGIAKAKYN